MFKKHMTPIGIHRKGSLHAPADKGSTVQAAANAARGGASNTLQDYAKATPMANPQPPDDNMGFGAANGDI